MTPIPGQPGLFRNGARRTAMAGYTWNYPRSERGRPWVLGSVATEAAGARGALDGAQIAYNKLKTALQPLLDATPFSAAEYERIARFAAAQPRSATLQISKAQFTQIARGMLSTSSAALTLASSLLVAPSTSAQVARAAGLIARANAVMSRFSQALGQIRAAQSLASRATSLGIYGVDDSVLILAAIIAGTLIILFGAYELFAIIVEQQRTQNAIEEATRACEYDAAQGRPCSTADFQAAVEAARRTQQENGLIPNLNDLVEAGGSLLFWGGLLTIGALLGYAAWTAEPARRNVQERLRRSTDEARMYDGPRGVAGVSCGCSRKR